MKFSWPDGATSPFQGEKATTWEAGVRVPAIIRWPGVVKPDSVINDIFGHGLNPSFPDYLGNKVGFDATQPYPPRPEFERAKVKEVSLEGLDISVPDLVARAPGPKPPVPVPAAPPAADERTQTLLDYILDKTGGRKASAAPTVAKQRIGDGIAAD